MKKILTIIILLAFFAVTASAQTGHLEFMGIPITGTPIQMGQKLKAKGFTFKGNLDEDIREYTGKFAGNNVSLYVASQNNNVWKIVVDYIRSNSFTTLKSAYNKMVTQFTLKYGDPMGHFEYFKDPYYEGDGFELQALKLQKCCYFTGWSLEKGNISVTISAIPSILISYEDLDGVNKKQDNESEQILNDI